MVANNSVLLRWSNIVAFVLTVIVNSLAGSTKLIGGVTTAQISDSNPTLITPAGYVFSIWGIIYVLLGVFVDKCPFSESKSWVNDLIDLDVIRDWTCSMADNNSNKLIQKSRAQGIGS